jgi:hypothetical protein
MQVVAGAANIFFLLACGVKEPEAVLKAVAIPHFGFEL